MGELTTGSLLDPFRGLADAYRPHCSYAGSTRAQPAIRQVRPIVRLLPWRRCFIRRREWSDFNQRWIHSRWIPSHQNCGQLSPFATRESCSTRWHHPGSGGLLSLSGNVNATTSNGRRWTLTSCSQAILGRGTIRMDGMPWVKGETMGCSRYGRGRSRVHQKFEAWDPVKKIWLMRQGHEEATNMPFESEPSLPITAVTSFFGLRTKRRSSIGRTASW